MANVILENKTKRPRKMIVLNLTLGALALKVVNRTTEESKDGLRRARVSSKLVPGAIRIPSGGKLEVPESYLGCPEVKAAIARREIRVIRKAPVAVTNGNGNGPKPRTKRRG